MAESLSRICRDSIPDESLVEEQPILPMIEVQGYSAINRPLGSSSGMILKVGDKVAACTTLHSAYDKDGKPAAKLQIFFATEKGGELKAIEIKKIGISDPKRDIMVMDIGDADDIVRKSSMLWHGVDAVKVREKNESMLLHGYNGWTSEEHIMSVVILSPTVDVDFEGQRFRKIPQGYYSTPGFYSGLDEKEEYCRIDMKISGQKGTCGSGISFKTCDQCTEQNSCVHGLFCGSFMSTETTYGTTAPDAELQRLFECSNTIADLQDCQVITQPLGVTLSTESNYKEQLRQEWCSFRGEGSAARRNFVCGRLGWCQKCIERDSELGMLVCNRCDMPERSRSHSRTPRNARRSNFSDPPATRLSNLAELL